MKILLRRYGLAAFVGLLSGVGVAAFPAGEPEQSSNIGRPVPGGQSASGNPAVLSPLQTLGKQLAIAQAGGEDAVRRAVDTAFEQGVFRKAGSSVRQRVVDAELAFRAGKLEPIPNSAIHTTFNSIRARLGLPKGLDTTLAQVRLFAGIIQRRVPELGSPLLDEPDVHSPLAAAIITMRLASQKAFTPEYRLPPVVWVERATMRLNGRTPPALAPSRDSGVIPEASAILHVTPTGRRVLDANLDVAFTQLGFKTLTKEPRSK